MSFQNMGLSRTEVISAMLSIDNTEENNYKSEGPHVKNVSGPKRVYGGYVVAQAYKAVKEYARKIKDENPIFSMHYNFLSSGMYVE
uniref:Acyl-CoA thioesterase-like N-terminal HotDog domain-containing protein n=2 Tax=Caenorhabditis japonica TaxID=281687 RepID=A0A8R1E8L3_CAEJA